MLNSVKRGLVQVRHTFQLFSDPVPVVRKAPIPNRWYRNRWKTPVRLHLQNPHAELASSIGDLIDRKIEGAGAPHRIFVRHNNRWPLPETRRVILYRTVEVTHRKGYMKTLHENLQ